VRLVLSDVSAPGIRRLRCGSGFRYLGPDGRALQDPAALARVRALVLPPAWTDVWICPDPCGHIQAMGTDAAGRRQYRYHDAWRQERDKAKHARVLEFASVLPQVRARVEADLQGRGYSRARVLAAAVRLLDLGFFRSGSDEYTAQNGTYGLATVLRSHVRCGRGYIVFEYLAKGSKQREQSVVETTVCKVIAGLKRRRDPGPELLAYRTPTGWHDVRASDINAYLREISGGDYTAKDFRTWHATVLAAVGLAVSTAAPDTPTAQRRAIARVVKEVSEYLGNTPAVARSSYIDPRVFTEFENGVTIASELGALASESRVGELATRGRIEDAVRRMLTAAGEVTVGEVTAEEVAAGDAVAPEPAAPARVRRPRPRPVREAAVA
jgi:DNA topoisomerase IB